MRQTGNWQVVQTALSLLKVIRIEECTSQGDTPWKKGSKDGCNEILTAVMLMKGLSIATNSCSIAGGDPTDERIDQMYATGSGDHLFQAIRHQILLLQGGDDPTTQGEGSIEQGPSVHFKGLDHKSPNPNYHQYDFAEVQAQAFDTLSHAAMSTLDSLDSTIYRSTDRANMSRVRSLRAELATVAYTDGIYRAGQSSRASRKRHEMGFNPPYTHDGSALPGQARTEFIRGASFREGPVREALSVWWKQRRARMFGRLIMEQAMAVTDGGVPYEDSSDDDE